VRHVTGHAVALLVLACALPWLGCRSTAPPRPGAPITRIDTVVDTLHGETFPDPYRWLEQQSSTETRAWLAAQEAYADAELPRNEQRLALERRLAALLDRAEIGAPRRGGDVEYFTLRRVGEELPAIYRRPAPATRTPIDPAARYDLLIDPLPLSPDATTRVELTAVDRQGRYLVYGVRDGGQDEFEMRIRDLAANADLPDRFPAALYSSVVVTTEGDGFYYSVRSRQTGARIRRHAWKTDPATDPLVFGEG